jgi:endonuclease/exonuclease/phosphatase family metal-dependent hydrolase
MDHYAVPVLGMQNLEATTIHLVLATKPVKLVAAYFLPTRPVIDSDLTECLSGRFPVLIAGDLNAKHTDWNSGLATVRGSILRDYANRNSCLVCGPDSQTTVTYTHSATPDVLDMVVVKDFVPLVHLTACPALSSDHLPVLIDTTCRPSFQNRNAPTSREWTRQHSRLNLNTDSRGIPR